MFRENSDKESEKHDCDGFSGKKRERERLQVKKLAAYRSNKCTVMNSFL